MPFVNKARLEQLQDENEYISSRLQELEEMRPFLAIAEDIKTRIVEQLDAEQIAGSAEIAEIAYRSVLESEMDRAKDELTAKYEQEHRRALYSRVLGELEQEEGETIYADVVTRLESDVQVATELRESARKELQARAKDDVSANVTAEQKKVIDAETSRQIDLDRLDVRLALDGSLPLSEETTNILKPHDKLVIMFEKAESGQAGIVFSWQEDINGQKGWVFSKGIDSGYRRTMTGNLPTDRFVRIGVQMPDLQQGNKKVKQDALVAHCPLVVTWTDENSREKNQVIKEAIRPRYGYGYSYQEEKSDSKIASSDFQTRDIEFAK